MNKRLWWHFNWGSWQVIVWLRLHRIWWTGYWPAKTPYMFTYWGFCWVEVRHFHELDKDGLTKVLSWAEGGK